MIKGKKTFDDGEFYLLLFVCPVGADFVFTVRCGLI
jgi:hypothetical protein